MTDEPKITKAPVAGHGTIKRSKVLSGATQDADGKITQPPPEGYTGSERSPDRFPEGVLQVYAAAMENCAIAARLVSMHDLPQMQRTIEFALQHGPELNPEQHEKKRPALEADLALIKAAMPLWEATQAFDAEQAGPPEPSKIEGSSTLQGTVTAKAAVGGNIQGSSGVKQVKPGA